MSKQGTYSVTFIGDYFTLTSTPVTADDEWLAICEAGRTIEYQYGFDVIAVSTVEINVTEIGGDETITYDRDEIRCINCENLNATVEGGLCADCFAQLTPGEWQSKW